jgi:hypothetical protein
MDTEVADAVKGQALVETARNRPIKGYDEVMPVFGISFDAIQDPSRWEIK